eukprot:8172271-Karenia_brevis.AAC.1
MGALRQITFRDAWKHPSLIHGRGFAGKQTPWKCNFDQLAEQKLQQTRKHKRGDAGSSHDP